MDIPAFKVIEPDGRTYKLFEDGRAEGFPPGAVVVNYLLPLRLLAELKIAKVWEDTGDQAWAWGDLRLGSLLDMLRQLATAFVFLGEQIAAVETTLYMAEKTPESPLKDDEIAEMVTLIGAMQGLCQKAGMPVSEELLKSSRDAPPKTAGEFKMLVRALKAELRKKLFLLVPQERAPFFEKDDYLSDAARAAFPNADAELRQAGNAFASGLYTATVFHCMRALEYGIGALAKDVAVTYDVQNWQNILDQIAKAIGDAGKAMSAGSAKSDRLQFLSEAVAEFRHFKDGWRNHVSHNKVAYDESQARRALEHVATFIETLSRRITE